MGVQWPAPLEVVRRLIEVSEQRGEPLEGAIVLVGGSAMAAHGIRAESLDVDVYTPKVGEQAVAQVEAESRVRYGPGFTSAGAIIARFNTLLAGIGERAAIPSIADALVGSLVAQFHLPPAGIIGGLAVNDELNEDLREAHDAA